MHYDTRQMYFIIYSNSVISNMEYDFKVKEILVRNKWKNTEGFCIIQVDDNGFCKPVTHNHKWSMYLFTSIQFIISIYRGLALSGNLSGFLLYILETREYCDIIKILLHSKFSDHVTRAWLSILMTSHYSRVSKIYSNLPSMRHS